MANKPDEGGRQDQGREDQGRAGGSGRAGIVGGSGSSGKVGSSGGVGGPGGRGGPGGVGGAGGVGGSGRAGGSGNVDGPARSGEIGGSSGGSGGSGGSIEDVLAALVDPTRRRLLDALANRGEASATSLATEVPVSRQAVVKHLAALDRAGLVEGHRAGREVRYRITTHGLSDTAQWMADLAADWDTRLTAIKHIAESDPQPPPANPNPPTEQ